MKQLLIKGDKTFKITIEDTDKVTFGPWSPPRADDRSGYHEPGGKRGTLRVYRGSKENIVACFSGIESFRDLSLGYAEEVAREEGATIWKSDEHGYQREEKVSARRDWVESPMLPEKASRRKAPF